MTTWLPPLLAAGSITVTYFLCVRPHLRGRVLPGAPGRDTGLDRQLAELKEDLRILRPEDTLATGPRPTREPGPPSDNA